MFMYVHLAICMCVREYVPACINMYACICEHIHVCIMYTHAYVFILVCLHFLSQSRETFFTLFALLLVHGYTSLLQRYLSLLT